MTIDYHAERSGSLFRTYFSTWKTPQRSGGAARSFQIVALGVDLTVSLIPRQARNER